MEKEKKSKKGIIAIAIILVVFIIFFASNIVSITVLDPQSVANITLNITIT